MSKSRPDITARLWIRPGQEPTIMIRRGELASMKVSLKEAVTLANELVDIVEEEERR